VARLCESGVKAVVAFGDDDEIGLTDEERRGLEAAPNVSLVTITEATHFMIVEQPTQLADLISELAGAHAGGAIDQEWRSAGHEPEIA
jgi:pimeloyl-ACP methyl ester carboxylesterase